MSEMSPGRLLQWYISDVAAVRYHVFRWSVESVLRTSRGAGGAHGLTGEGVGGNMVAHCLGCVQQDKEPEPHGDDDAGGCNLRVISECVGSGIYFRFFLLSFIFLYHFFPPLAVLS